MERDFPSFELSMDFLNPEASGVSMTSKDDENPSKKARFADINNENLNLLVEGAQAKKTKESTKWAVTVFQG